MAWYSGVSPFPSAPFATNRDEAMMRADAYFRANPSGAVQFFINGPGGYWAYIRADWVQRRGEWATYSYPSGSPLGGTAGAPAATAPSGYSAPVAGTPRPPAQGEMTAPSARPAPYAAEGTHLTAQPVEGQQFVYPVAGTMTGYVPAATAPRVTYPDRETRPPDRSQPVLPVPGKPREPEPGYDTPGPDSPAFLWGLLQPAREQPSPEGDSTPVFLGQVIPPGPEGIWPSLQGQVVPPAPPCDCDPRLQLYGGADSLVRYVVGKAALLRIRHAKVGAPAVLAGMTEQGEMKFLFKLGTPLLKEGGEIPVSSLPNHIDPQQGNLTNVEANPFGLWWLFNRNMTPEEWTGLQMPFVVLMTADAFSAPKRCDIEILPKIPNSLSDGYPYAQMKAVPSWHLDRLAPNWQMDVPGADVGSTEGYAKYIASLPPEHSSAIHEGKPRQVWAFCDSPGPVSSMYGNKNFFTLLSGLFKKAASVPPHSDKNHYYEEVGDRAGLYAVLEEDWLRFRVIYLKCFKAGFRVACKNGDEPPIIQPAPSLSWIAGWRLTITSTSMPVQVEPPIVDPELVLQRIGPGVEGLITVRDPKRALRENDYELYRSEVVVREVTRPPQLCAASDKGTITDAGELVYHMENRSALEGKRVEVTRKLRAACLPIAASAAEHLNIVSSGILQGWVETRSVRSQLSDIMGIPEDVRFITGTAELDE